MKFPEWLVIYGDQSYRDSECPKEGAEQATFFNWIRREYPKSYGLVATHIKNEGKRHRNQLQIDKSQGLTKGAPDIIIPAKIPFICELKRRDHTKSAWQSGQLEYLEQCHESGCFVVLALGVDNARQAFNDWLKLQSLNE